MNNSKKSWGKPSKAMVQLMLAAVMLVALIATAIPTMAQPPPASPGWYWKESYPNYAPSGMPDFSQRQDNWVNPYTGALSFCGPTALANCLWWFDSKYGNDTGVPGDGNDIFPLVRDYTDQLPPVPGPNWDDHNFNNVNDLATAWPPSGSPPALPPFVPGPQPQPQPIEPWGELIERLAWYMDCDGIRTGAPHVGTYISDMEAAIHYWLAEAGLDGLFSETTVPRPDFYFIEEEVERSEDVILLLGFWVWVEDESGVWVWQRLGGHYVTVAGVNSDELMIAFSDPFLDQILAPSPTEHNDAAIVSHDIWHVALDSPSPGGTWWIPDYGKMDGIGAFYAQNLPEEFEKLQAGKNVLAESGTMPTVHTEVEYAVIISPLPAVTTNPATDVTPTSATLNGTLDSLGSASYVDVYFEIGYDTSYGYTIYADTLTTPGPFSFDVSGLTPGTTYYYRAVAVGDDGTIVYGDAVSFTYVLPAVTTNPATNVTPTSATLNGTLDSLGSASYVDVYFVVGLTSSYTDYVYVDTLSAAPDSFSYDITSGLTPGTTYHYAAVLVDNYGTVVYGNDVTFSYILPTVTTDAATNVMPTSATFNGTLDSLGSASYVDVYFVAGLTSSYTHYVYVDRLSTAPDSFSYDIPGGLTPGTTYHYAAVLVDNYGTVVYGNDVTFTTPFPAGGP